MTDPAEVIRKALERWVYPEQNETDPEVRDALAALSELTAERDEARIEATDGLAAFRLAQEARDKWRADHDKVQAERDRLTGRVEALEHEWEYAKAERDRLREALRAIHEQAVYPDNWLVMKRIAGRALSQPPQGETGRELNARLARDFDVEAARRRAEREGKSQPPQEDKP